MTTIISGNTPSTIGNDTTISGDITANNLPAHGSIVGYQSGAFTPSFDSTGQITYFERFATWSRIGNTVTAYFNVAFSSLGTLSGSNNELELVNLPYPCTANSATAAGGSFTVDYWNQLADAYPSVSGYIVAGETKLRFYVMSKTSFNLVNAKLIHVTNTSSLRASLTYTTDDTTWTPSPGATVS